MRRGVKHSAGFIVSGALAFTTDAAILALLVHAFGFDPFSARLIAIAAAMIVAFFAHRRFTFAVAGPATWAQFANFLGVAATASIVNYGLYAVTLVVRPGTPPLAALVAATVVSMGVSYFGMRLGVFRKPDV